MKIFTSHYKNYAPQKGVNLLDEFIKYESKHSQFVYVEDTEAFVKKMLEVLNAGEIIGLDTETYYDPTRPDAIIKWINGQPNNVPFGVSFYIKDKAYWCNKELIKLKPLIETEHIPKVGHNLKYDAFMLANIGIELKGHIWDTMVMIHLIDEEMTCELEDGKMKQSKKLKDLAYHFSTPEERASNNAHEFQRLVKETRAYLAKQRGVGINGISFKDINDVNPQLMKDYACADTVYPMKLHKIFLPELQKQDLMRAYEVDINATKTVLNMERTGFAVNKGLMLRKEAELSALKDQKAGEIYRTVGREFNINSGAELVEQFEKLGVKWEWLTQTGQPLVDRGALKKIIEQGGKPAELAELVIPYRTVCKYISTYISGVYDYIQADGKIHCDFNINPKDDGQGGTVTGRLSSSNPNLHNQPKKPVEIDGITINVRDFFIPDEDYVLVFLDASQEEYRVLGHYGDDPAFMEMIHKGWDIHRGTAAMMKGKAYEDVTEEEREAGKTINFGLVYGLSNPQFAVALGHKIDIDRIKRGTKVLYKKNQAFKYPPYGDTPLVIACGYAEEPEEIDGIEYFYSDEVQNAINHACKVKDAYFGKFPKIKQFIKDISNAGKRRGYVKTWTGRRRHFKKPEIEAYKGCNSVIQGGCGDVLKVKLYEIDQWLREKELKSKLVNNVHDEICIMVHKTEVDIIPEIITILEDLPFKVPMTWEAKWSEVSWGQKKEFISLDDIRRLTR